MPHGNQPVKSPIQPHNYPRKCIIDAIKRDLEEKMSDENQEENHKKEYAVFSSHERGKFSTHGSLEDAKKEAERLANKAPDVKIKIFEEIGYFQSELKKPEFKTTNKEAA